jgi:rubrerythrin
MKKLLAQVCRICPACILRRAFPDSGYGRFMRHVERNCPFCRAYDDLYVSKPVEETSTEPAEG